MYSFLEFKTIGKNFRSPSTDSGIPRKTPKFTETGSRVLTWAKVTDATKRKHSRYLCPSMSVCTIVPEGKRGLHATRLPVLPQAEHHTSLVQIGCGNYCLRLP